MVLETLKYKAKRWLQMHDLPIPVRGGAMVAKTCLTAQLMEMDLNGDFVAVKGGRRVVRNRVVADTFVQWLVDDMQSASALIDQYNNHDSGVGTTAEVKTQGSLISPWAGARTSGSQHEGGSNNVYRTVALTEYTGSFAITEHMVFNQGSLGTGLDRSLFDPITVASGSKIEYTYDFQPASGG